ncbi:hypothetical protein B0H13DRAFT_1855911 [Mycena leptocephala]|nr:hypothetical protein B0H13DRAFT_1855911 [Mycena leptocephala]
MAANKPSTFTRQNLLNINIRDTKSFSHDTEMSCRKRSRQYNTVCRRSHVLRTHTRQQVVDDGLFCLANAQALREYHGLAEVNRISKPEGKAHTGPIGCLNFDGPADEALTIAVVLDPRLREIEVDERIRTGLTVI